MKHLVLAFVAVLSSLRSSVVSFSAPPRITPSLLDNIKLAMKTTHQAGINITKIHDACEQWEAIPKTDLPPEIRSVCLALQASCLTRIGRDLEALPVYDSCLDLRDCLNEESLQDVLLGKAFALQRLMRYEQARDTFLECPTERACIGAATCCLRLSDEQRAQSILSDFVAKPTDDAHAAQGILGTLLYIREQKTNRLTDRTLKLLKNGAKVSPLARWILCIASKGATNHLPIDDSSPSHPFDYLELAAVNQSPMDDPLLIHLDDKVFLHDLLTQPTLADTDNVSFWPHGFILPRDASMLEKEYQGNGNDWILKQRAGYGSHGNQIMSARQALERTNPEDYLCQRMVDPPLLLQDRKFSMRIYVLYFGEEAYLCKTDGLVKLASLPYQTQPAGVDDRMHMTNSGREDGMLQFDLKFLERELLKAGHSYTALWNEIHQAVSSVLQAYKKLSLQQTKAATFRKEVLDLGIPKILGLDFLVDADVHPQLIEVNRFPGLEARGDGDARVKQSVVHGAWTLAASRLGFDVRDIDLLDVESPMPLFERVS